MDKSFPATMNAYRLHFSCENIGRYIGSTKRRIRWCFGFTDLHRGIECRGEEHEVELVWSIHSEKVKIICNKRNISDSFSETGASGMVDVSWDTPCGHNFRILAHESPVSPCIPQYNFFVDGFSIFYLQHVSQLTRTTIIVDNMENCDVLSETSMDSTYSSYGPTGYDTEIRDAAELDHLGYSMFGTDPLEDDLTPSYSFTNILEYLRGAVTSIMPNLEDMVSRSIINALSEDNKSPREPDCITVPDCSSSISSTEQTPSEIEANLLWETTQWANSHLRGSPDPDVQEQKRLFLQKQMDNVFVHARHERLTEDSAARLLFDIATLLGYPVDEPRDTIIVRDLKREIDLDNLAETAMLFGELRGVGVATNRSFAFCRFDSVKGPLRALAAFDHGNFLVHGFKPSVTMIEKPSAIRKPDLLGRRARSTPFESSYERFQKPMRRRSHQRNTYSIDGSIVGSAPFIRLINETMLLSPLDS